MIKIQVMAIYAIRNLINEKIYVGSANNFSVRKMKHLADLRANRHHSLILQRAFNKYGEASFKFEIIEVLSNPNDLLWKEQHYLDTLKPQYNICKKVEQSRLGLKSSPEHCARISASLKGNKNCLGHHHSQKTKELLTKESRAMELKRGSFNQYLFQSGAFVTTMARAIQRADVANKERIRRAFPQMVAAYECPSFQAGVPLESD